MTSLTGASGEDFASILRSLGYRMDRWPKPAEPIAVKPAEPAVGGSRRRMHDWFSSRSACASAGRPPWVEDGVGTTTVPRPAFTAAPVAVNAIDSSHEGDVS
jgi:ATP-dependent RNA helicase SUPV3L1/SUV3